MKPINALTAIKPLGSATSGSSGREQGGQHVVRGQTLTATVLESAGNNKFYLDILGDKVLAKSETLTNLNPGSKLDLEVLSAKPTLELKIISQKPELFFGKTLTLLEKNLDVSKLFQSLTSSSVFGKLSDNSREGLTSFHQLQQLPIDPKNSGVTLKHLYNRLGLNLESSLAQGKSQVAIQTLKAALLEIASILKDGGELAETTNKFIGTLELYQLAQLRLTSENLLIFPLPLPFLENGYLLVEQNKNREGDEGDNKHSLHFSLHLSLEPLGNIEIDFLQTEDCLYIRFGCESDQAKTFTSVFQDELKNIISSTDAVSINFTDTAGNPSNDLVFQLLPEGKSILDTKI
jgi:hypothetical protein